NSGYVNLDYSVDGGVTWDTIATNQLDDGDYKGWIVPNTPSADCKIRISDVDGDPSAISDSLFTITGVVPVELVSFKANSNENKIMLSWKTATEINNKGFEIQRKLNSNWKKIGYVSGKGTSTNPSEYNYTDDFKYQSFRGIVSYRLKQIDFDGSYHFSNEIKLDIDFTPKEFTLYQNYPNPFNPSTTIKYALPFESRVEIIIYNIQGQKVTEFDEGIKVAGYHDINWHPGKVSSGVYFYFMHAEGTEGENNFTKTLKMLFTK
ncbi:MAG: T9SS type A sorting domain-containing protein, partial [Ignavibacteriaceae bacterium]